MSSLGQHLKLLTTTYPIGVAVVAIVAVFALLVGLYYIRKIKIKLKFSGSQGEQQELFATAMSRCFQEIMLYDAEDSSAVVYSYTDEGLAKTTVKVRKAEEIFGDVYPDDARSVLEDTPEQIIEQVMKTMSQKEYTYRRKNEAGDYAYVSLLLQGVRRDAEHNRACLILVRDGEALVSNEHKQIEKLQLALQEAEESAKAREHRFMKMSAEAKRIINVLNNFLTQAQDGAITADEVKVRLASAVSASENMKHMLSEALNMTTLEEGKFQIMKTSFSLREMLRQMAKSHYNEASYQGIDFEVIAQDLDENYVLGDMTQVNQILSNLLSNAFKFTPRGGSVTLTVAQEAARKGEVRIRFDVTDTGKGIAPEQQEKIFHAFQGGSEEENKGVGLGLAIVSGVVKAMGGTVSLVTSTVGKGSTFRVVVPFGFDAAKHEAEPAKRDYSELTAVLVDAHERSSLALSNILNKYAVTALPLANGAECIEAIEECAQDGGAVSICFITWELPDMDGLEVFMGINEMDPEGKLFKVLVTGTSSVGIEEKVRELGIDCILPKPFFKADILSILQHATGHKEAKENVRLAAPEVKVQPNSTPIVKAQKTETEVVKEEVTEVTEVSAVASSESAVNTPAEATIVTEVVSEEKPGSTAEAIEVKENTTEAKAEASTLNIAALVGTPLVEPTLSLGESIASAEASTPLVVSTEEALSKSPQVEDVLDTSADPLLASLTEGAEEVYTAPDEAEEEVLSVDKSQEEENQVRFTTQIETDISDTTQEIGVENSARPDEEKKGEAKSIWESKGQENVEDAVWHPKEDPQENILRPWLTDSKDREDPDRPWLTGSTSVKSREEEEKAERKVYIPTTKWETVSVKDIMAESKAKKKKNQPYDSEESDVVQLYPKRR